MSKKPASTIATALDLIKQVERGAEEITRRCVERTVRTETKVDKNTARLQRLEHGINEYNALPWYRRMFARVVV